MISKSCKVLLTVAVVAAISACGGGNNNGNNASDSEPVDDGFTLTGCADDNSCVSNPPTTIGGERPAMVQVPSNYDNSTRYPLVMVLHGRGANGLIQSFYFGLFDRVDSRQFVLIYPDGLTVSGSRQWRFTPTCCDTPQEEAAARSDVSYLSGLIEEAAATYSIDTTRIGIIGHSSGGFMSFTMACEASHLVTAMVNLAGSTFVDLQSCQPSEERVSVLSVHGDLDDTVPYDGVEGAFLSAPKAAERYAILGGCDTNSPFTKPAVDLVANIDGAETSKTAWPDCLQGTEVEFWTINNGPHIPGPWMQSGLDSFVDWLLQHPRS